MLINFLKCGFAGWCIEILFTAFHSLRRRDLSLRGETSLWMFPIYGLAFLFAPVCRLVKKKPFWFRGSFYACCIFAAEYITGRILWVRNLCPWDYQSSRWNIGRLIRLDYAPYWFFTGLFFEKLVLKQPAKETLKKVG